MISTELYSAAPRKHIAVVFVKTDTQPIDHYSHVNEDVTLSSRLAMKIRAAVTAKGQVFAIGEVYLAAYKSNEVRTRVIGTVPVTRTPWLAIQALGSMQVD